MYSDPVKSTKVVPYDTGKVKIGLMYTPPNLNHMSRDAELLQAALLRPQPPLPARVARSAIRGLPWGVLALILAAMVLLSGFRGIL